MIKGTIKIYFEKSAHAYEAKVQCKLFINYSITILNQEGLNVVRYANSSRKRESFTL